MRFRVSGWTFPLPKNEAPNAHRAEQAKDGAKSLVKWDPAGSKRALGNLRAECQASRLDPENFRPLRPKDANRQISQKMMHHPER